MRGYAVVDEVDNSVGNDSGFTRTSASENEKRSGGMKNSFTLRGIESGHVREFRHVAITIPYVYVWFR
jgi:hypothetical protein